MAPTLRKYVKKIVNNSLSHEEGVMMITEKCSEMIQSKMPKKMKDPGSFVLNCEIGRHTFENSLCDLGSSVNLMPFSVAKKLGMTEFAPTPLVLVLADRSVRTPKGLLEDVPVKVGECWIPADFIILDYERNEPKDPLILGRPFLATAGAVIDCKHGRIELKVDDISMVFEMDKKLKKPTIDGQSFMIETPDVNMFDVGDEEHKKMIEQPQLATTSAAPATVTKQKAPNIKPLPSKQRYAFSKPKSKFKHIIAGSIVGSIPPNIGALPCSIPRFLGKPHAPTAYTPPWMKRVSKKHSMPLSKPPDI